MDRINNLWLLTEYWDSEVEDGSGIIVFPKGYTRHDLKGDQEEYGLGEVRFDLVMQTRYKNRISLFFYDDIKTQEDWFKLAGMEFSLMMFPIEFKVERDTLWVYLLTRLRSMGGTCTLSILY